MGSQTYSSQALAAGYSGFHVLVLDEWLTQRENLTFTINGPADATVDPNATAEMAQALHDARTPGNLVVVQSIGDPYGTNGDWLFDNVLFDNAHGEDGKVPRAPTTWAYGGQQTGQAGSLAYEMGMLGGPVAHDQIAQLNVNTHDDGYTMIAAAGQETGYFPWQSEPVEPVLSSSAPVSRVQLPQPSGVTRPPARIVGTLSRDRQSLWKVDSPSALPGPLGSQLRQIAYQPPTRGR